MNRTQAKILLGSAALAVPFLFWQQWQVLIALLATAGYMLWEVRTRADG